ncbi:MAG: hypothetical protein IT228_08825 [Flavobacteriales bacterium]|nr:hypothetical protein [Flavobacteriales bacterium]MCC6577431.1 hypothetical protein [Flavobacteriales bacterium]NUQ14695.1 hypothetical protein [Flavobacteriales bacterium]
MSRAPLLLLALLLAADMARAQAPADTSLRHRPERSPLKLRAIGGTVGITLENHGPMGLDRFMRFARQAPPTLPGKPTDYYFGYSSTAIGGILGPRFALARLRTDGPAARSATDRRGVEDRNNEHGWTFHLGLQPRLFHLYFHTDSLLGDTARTVEYLYTLAQTEIAVGGGPYWTLFLSNTLFLRPGLLAELGHAGTGTLTATGTRTDAFGGTTTETTLLDRSVPARACTYLRASACLQAGFRIAKRVDLSARAQWGTGLMWLHGVDLTALRSSTLYALDLAFLIRR